MKICRYDKDANPNSCGGCQYGCIERKAAIINEDFERAVKDMENSSVKVGNKMKPKASGLDTRGHLYVDCAECQRGGNGDKSCSAGAKHKKINKGMCFCGQLLEKYSL